MNDLTQSDPRRIFSRCSFALAAFLLVGYVMALAWSYAVPRIFGSESWLVTSSWGMWLGSFLPLYLVAAPVCILLFRGIPQKPQEKNKLGAKSFFLFLMMCFPLMYGGSIIGTLLSFIFSGGTASNNLIDYALDTNPLKIVVVVVLAPMIEEFIFRKQLIDHTSSYGEKLAIFFSALAFALLHRNLYQFFYAFGLGLLFAYVYTRTGRLRYSVLMHMLINFLGAVVTPWILSFVDAEALSHLDASNAQANVMAILPGVLILLRYVFLIFVLFIAGLVILIIQSRKLVFLPAKDELPKGQGIKTAYLNAGSVLYVLLCLGFTVYALL